jgi:F-type H+-transporting ATPase subunit b
MLIDWFTVGAQLLNFLILVWLLKRFLYKPVRGAIDAREKRIAGELANAASKLTDAQKQHDEFDRKNQAFDAERGALLAKATQQSKDERAKLLEQARKEADELRVTYASALSADGALLGRQVSRLAQREVFAIARKTLSDLASANLEERMAETFTRRLRALDATPKDLLAAALRDSREPALLRSGFELPAAERATLQNALNVAFSAEVRVRFVTAPDAVCGIELSANGQKLSWSIEDYLNTLEQELRALVDKEGAPAPIDKAAAQATPTMAGATAPAPPPAPAPAAAPPAAIAHAVAS